jgi:glyoxylase-like metal-dependent hydrolase (beta-lactamase superfamily II)
MSFVQHHTLSRRGFCLCCVAAAGCTATGGWLSPSQAYAEARNIVDSIRDDAARAPIKLQKVRRDVSILEGSGGNIAVLTGADGKVFIDAGITASRPRILEAANSISRDPIRHLINTHWHFDHADGNTWLNAEGAAHPVIAACRERIASEASRRSVSPALPGFATSSSTAPLAAPLVRASSPSAPKRSAWMSRACDAPPHLRAAFSRRRQDEGARD